jgi:hypothetical protein
MNNAEKLKRKIAESMVRGQKYRANAKYGEFVVQSNEVQYMLALVVLLRSSFTDKDYENWLYEKAGLGTLISQFKACAHRTPSMYQLLLQLKDYKKFRDRLAHKMFSSKTKLTLVECEKAIALGEKIIPKLYRLAKIPKKLWPKF